MPEQNIICSKTRLNNGATHEQAIICRQLFTGHVVGLRPMERKRTMRRIIKIIVNSRWPLVNFIEVNESDISTMQHRLRNEAFTKQNVIKYSDMSTGDGFDSCSSRGFFKLYLRYCLNSSLIMTQSR